jgi:hypothetical protein
MGSARYAHIHNRKNGTAPASPLHRSMFNVASTASLEAAVATGISSANAKLNRSPAGIVVVSAKYAVAFWGAGSGAPSNVSVELVRLTVGTSHLPSRERGE